MVTREAQVIAVDWSMGGSNIAVRLRTRVLEDGVELATTERVVQVSRADVASQGQFLRDLGPAAKAALVTQDGKFADVPLTLPSSVSTKQVEQPGETIG